ncbi:MAG: hypothetical protein MOGMAGMI_02107 [Candidatus Omnitrophica bacterium]|nr:hypothetical protein [Candidatus Omnitrophota bacterium]
MSPCQVRVLGSTIRAAVCAALVLALCALRLNSAGAISAMPEPTVCLSGTCFTAHQTAAALKLPLRGVSTYRYYGMKLFTAALYAPMDASGAQGVLSDVPKRLVLRYHRKIGRQHLIKAAEHNLRGLPEQRLAAIRERLDRLNACYQDVDKGDEYALVYAPERGTTLERNGSPVITVPGQDFAREYFGIWLSARSISSDLTHDLLGVSSGKRLLADTELSAQRSSAPNRGYVSSGD